MRSALIAAFLSMALTAVPAFSAPVPLGVIKSAKGDAKLTAPGAASVPAEGSAPVTQGARLETGADGKTVVRLLPDHAFLDVHPQSAFTLKRIKAKDKRVRRLTLDKAEVVVGLKKKSEPVQCENALTLATAAAGRFSCRSDEKGVATFLVQDGELSIYNRPKDVSVTARSGQKAVSDLEGVRVTDATDSELDLAGFSQNVLEVDFVNPQTEDFTTLEVEYESNF